MLLPATARPKGYSTMMSLGLRIYADNGSMRGRLNLALLLNRNSLSERFRNVKDLKKSGVLAPVLEVANGLNRSKNTIFANRILICLR